MSEQIKIQVHAPPSRKYAHIPVLIAWNSCIFLHNSCGIFLRIDNIFGFAVQGGWHWIKQRKTVFLLLNAVYHRIYMSSVNTLHEFSGWIGLRSECVTFCSTYNKDLRQYKHWGSEGYLKVNQKLLNWIILDVSSVPNMIFEIYASMVQFDIIFTSCKQIC